MRLVGHHGAFYRSVTKPLPRICQQLCRTPACRRYAHKIVPQVELRKTPNPRAKNIAVLGGGLTGLTTAFQLARTIPHAKVTIFEQKAHLGGWMDSQTVQVDGGEVLFEWGPRTLRPDQGGAGLATLALLLQLDLSEGIITIDKSAPAATNRYVYYPDHLVRMPGPSPSGNLITNIARNIYSAFSEPIYKGVVSGLLAEPAVRTRSPQVADESLGSFLRRRFGPALTDNLASAVIHGIYAGDIYDLSARTLMPSLWYAETRDPGGNGIITEFADLAFKKQHLRSYSDISFQNLIVEAKDIVRGDERSDVFLNYMGRKVNVYTYSNGLGHIARTLSQKLEANPNVTVRTSTAIDGLEYDNQAQKIKVAYSGSSSDDGFDYVVSTLSPAHLKGQLNSIRKSGSDTSALAQQFDRASEAVTVMVVNLYYSNPELLSVQGFGYLIPQSIPTDQNPERALGVIFGSETSGMRGPEAALEFRKFTSGRVQQLEDQMQELAQQIETQTMDETAKAAVEAKLDNLKLSHRQATDDAKDPSDKSGTMGQDTAPGTKLTVMMGGHWWKHWTESDLPSEAEAIEMAKSVLARHLNITEAPAVAMARLQKNCIPQYRPGYRQSMAAIHNEVLQDFKGQLKLAGPWWQGAVGVNDCVRKARLAAFSIREEWDDKTGLEEYSKKEQYVIGDERNNVVVMDPLQS